MASNFRNFMDMSIAIEEDNVLNDGTPATGEIDVGELVTAEENVEEITELKTEIETANDVVDESVTVAEELEQQVEINEEIIENQPETVTDDMVVAAQEHFFLKLGQLHFDIDYAKSKRVSMEEAVAPVTKLRLSTEGIKETLGVIWDKIKQFFARIGAAIKNFISKIMNYFKTGTKKIESLITIFKGANKNINVTKEINEDLFKSCGTMKGLMADKPGNTIESIKKTYESQIANLHKLIDGNYYNMPSVLDSIDKSVIGLPILSGALKKFISNKGEMRKVVVNITKKATITELALINSKESKFEKDVINASEGEIADLSSINTKNIVKDLEVAKKLYTSFSSYAEKINNLRDKAYKAAGKTFDEIKAWDAKDDYEKDKVKEQRAIMLLCNKVGNTYAFGLLNGFTTEINLVVAGYSVLSKHI